LERCASTARRTGCTRTTAVIANARNGGAALEPHVARVRTTASGSRAACGSTGRTGFRRGMAAERRSRDRAVALAAPARAGRPRLSRYPTFDELFHPDEGFITGNADLEPEGRAELRRGRRASSWRGSARSRTCGSAATGFRREIDESIGGC
jgi:hypothetical protein